MAEKIAALLDAAGMTYRRVKAAGAEGFLLSELPSGETAGIGAGRGLFLIATKNAAELAGAAAAGAEIVESGTLRLGSRSVPVHRYKKPGEAPGNLKRRSAWFQQRF